MDYDFKKSIFVQLTCYHAYTQVCTMVLTRRKQVMGLYDILQFKAL